MEGYFLKFTAAVSGAVSTILRMGSHDQFESAPSQSQCFLSAGVHCHAIHHLYRTGSNRLFPPGDLHKAQPT